MVLSFLGGNEVSVRSFMHALYCGSDVVGSIFYVVCMWNSIVVKDIWLFIFIL